MSELQVPTRWRDALSELEPAPHVLADLLEAVREVPVRRVARPLRRIAPAVLAAAALVVGGWLLMRGPTPGPGGDGEHPAFSLEAAVSIGELDAVREAIGPLDRWFDSLDEAEMPTADEPWSVMPFHITLPWPEGALPLATWGRVKSAPSDKLAPSVVRYVIRRGVTPEVTRRWDGVGPLPLRNVVLGDELVGRWRKQLAELGAPVEGRELRLVLSTDEANPVETQVFVPLTTGHSGSLVIENDLARAMRLHQFEMPGGIEVATPRDVVTCRRAWLRVRAPALGFDEAMEVAVAPAPASIAANSEGAWDVPTLRVTGVDAQQAMWGVMMVRSARLAPQWPGAAPADRGEARIVAHAGGTEMPGNATQRKLEGGDLLLMPVQSWRGTALRIGATTYAHLPDMGSTSKQSGEMRMSLVSTRLAPSSPLDPGSAVVLSSVWRGGQAIAGPDLATSSVVDAEGAVEWVHTTRSDPRCVRIGLHGPERLGGGVSVVRWIAPADAKASLDPRHR